MIRLLKNVGVFALAGMVLLLSMMAPPAAAQEP